MVTMRYTYLGPSGTFTESALLSVPGASDAERIPATSVPDALARLNAGEADAAMVPIENSVEGGVSATLDAIAASEGVRIIREVLVPIRFVLVAAKPISIEVVKTISPHSHAWAQVRGWAQENVPTAAALPSGAVKACSSMPTFTITSVEDGQGELKVQGNMATSCAEGDFLAGASNQVLVYSSTSPTGGVDVDHLVASGTFDLSSDPLIIPNGGRAVTLRFGEQHYFRTAKDLDLKGLSVRPSFDRGSPSSATAKSSTNSPMTIASSTSSNANQEAQDEQAAGEAIQWQVKHDYPLVKERLLHQWTPQLSSKQVGLVADVDVKQVRELLCMR